MLVAHEATVPPSSHVFTIDKAPWAQNICGPDSLQIVEENYGYKLNVSITCGSINVTKLFSMIAEVSGATDYVANPAYYNISDGKLIQSPEGDWIFSKFDSSDRIDVNFSGNPDSYDFVLPAQDGSTHTVRLTKDQVTSVFAASLVSDGNGVDLGSTPTLEPLSIVTESIVEIPEALTVSPQVDSATSQEPSIKTDTLSSDNVDNSNYYGDLLDSLSRPDSLTNLNLIEKLGLLAAILFVGMIGKWAIISRGEDDTEEPNINQLRIDQNNRNAKSNVGIDSGDYGDAQQAISIQPLGGLETGKSTPDDSSKHVVPVKGADSNDLAKPKPSFTFPDRESSLDHLKRIGIELPPPMSDDEYRKIVDMLNSMDKQESDIRDNPNLSPYGNIGFSSKKYDEKPIDKSPITPSSNILSEDDNKRLGSSGIDNFINKLLGGKEDDSK